MMVAVFGTMAADGIHDGASIPYSVTTPVFAAIVAAIFLVWYRSEGTLSIHSINTRRREAFYWTAVLAPSRSAPRPATSPRTRSTSDSGPRRCCSRSSSPIPASRWWRFNLNPIVAFWAAYVVTRPLGASFADGFSKPTNGGLGLGDGVVSAIALVVFIALVAYVTVTKRDVQDASVVRASGDPLSGTTCPNRIWSAPPSSRAPKAEQSGLNVQKAGPLDQGGVASAGSAVDTAQQRRGVRFH